MSTLYDVAKLAGVSPKTVSRVFNESHLVAEKTRQRVMAAVEKLDYHPNAIAASLKKQRTNIIGFVVPYGSDFVFQDQNMMEQIRGAHDLLTREGYEVLISAPVDKKDALQEILRLVKRRNVDGVILYPSAGVDRVIKEFKEKNFFYVTLGLCFEEQRTNFVDVNITPGAYAAAKYLISLGHRRIGVINKPSNFFILEKDDLLRGYRAALEEAGINYQAELISEGDFTFEGGYRAFQKLKALNPSITAVICSSDPMAYGAVKAISEAGLTANRDIEVISGDNLPLTQKLYPYMSSLHNPAYEQGRQAGKMIAAVIRRGVEIPGITLDTEFVIRNEKL
ncbi:MAG: LacI family DNA-binding transcriptional regulator [Bacillota bacterium]